MAEAVGGPEPGGPAPARLAPAALAARLDHVLACAASLIARVPEAALDRRGPREDRTIRDLAFQIFRLGLAFADGMDRGRTSEGCLGERAPADLGDGAAIGRYGALVRGRLGGWFEGAAPSEYARLIEADDGPRSGHGLLERTTAQAAHRLRQLCALAAEAGISPPEPLPAADLEGLP